MRHHNYYNRGNWQPSRERGVIGLSPRRLSPSLGSDGVELRLTYFVAGLAEEDVVIGIGFKRRIEINDVGARVWKLVGVAQPRRNYPENIIGS